jgi:hypothetical protein
METLFIAGALLAVFVLGYMIGLERGIQVGRSTERRIIVEGLYDAADTLEYEPAPRITAPYGRRADGTPRSLEECD